MVVPFLQRSIRIPFNPWNSYQNTVERAFLPLVHTMKKKKRGLENHFFFRPRRLCQTKLSLLILYSHPQPFLLHPGVDDHLVDFRHSDWRRVVMTANYH